MILGVVYLAQGNPSAAPMTANHLLPAWNGIASIVLIVSNFGAYSGMEMNAVHVNRLQNPSKQFPKAMFLAMILVLCVLILPPLVISWFIPAEELSLTAGVMQAFDAVFAHFGIQILTPIVGLAIVSASLAGFMTWLSGPSRSLLLVSQEGGFLPPWFQKTNPAGVQVNILAAQGVVTTILALLFAFVPAVSDAYWMFMTITTSVYLLMYLWLFRAAMNLRKRQPDHPRGYRAPALNLLCVLGLRLLARRDPDQLRAAVPVRRRQPGGVRPDRRRRDPAAGRGHPLPARQVPQAELEGRALGGGHHDPGHREGGVVTSHRTIYLVVAGVLAALLVVMLVTWNYRKSNEEALAKAQQLITAFDKAGLRSPRSAEEVARVMGTDGGPVCASVEDGVALGIAKLNLSVGGAFYTRPVIADGRLRTGLLLVVQTYCPEKVPTAEQFLNNQSFGTWSGTDDHRSCPPRPRRRGRGRESDGAAARGESTT